MDERERNPVREEAAVRAHAWCVRLWNERKISAEFTIADEAGLIEMMIGLLTMFPPPVAADFTLNAESNLAPETQAALGDEVARAVYLHRLESELYGMRTQLGDSRDLRAQLESDNTELRRQLAKAHAKIANDEIKLERCGTKIESLHHQLAEAQDNAANAWARAAASPALIEEYARACHYAGSSGLAMVDWPQWLSQRATRE